MSSVPVSTAQPRVSSPSQGPLPPLPRSRGTGTVRTQARLAGASVGTMGRELHKPQGPPRRGPHPVSWQVTTALGCQGADSALKSLGARRPHSAQVQPFRNSCVKSQQPAAPSPPYQKPVSEVTGGVLSPPSPGPQPPRARRLPFFLTRALGARHKASSCGQQPGPLGAG